MSREQWEVIFFGDGSDGSDADASDRLAAEHEHFFVLHLPISGGPCRSRNVGIDRAPRIHVFNTCHHDWFQPEALARIVSGPEKRNLKTAAEMP